jgi:hypothetical protein
LSVQFPKSHKEFVRKGKYVSLNVLRRRMNTVLIIRLVKNMLLAFIAGLINTIKQD